MKVRPSMTRVALLEGNETLRRLFAEVLAEASMEAVWKEGGAAELADLLVVDVDSDLDGVEAVTQAYEEAKRPILAIGLKHSLDAHADGPWLSRPFSGSTFVHHCRELLGLTGPDEPTEDVMPSEIPPPIAAELREDPPTVEIDPEEVLALEGRLGLHPGGLANQVPTLRASVDDVIDLGELDEEASMVVSVESIRGRVTTGGTVVSGIEERMLPLQKLEEQAQSLILPSPIRPQNVHSTTLPDAPAVVRGAGSRVGGRVGSSPGEGSPAPLQIQSSGSAARAMSSTGLSPDTIQAVQDTARMLAEAWDRLGLAARAEDRADRIERILFALFKDGLHGASEEIRRIPMAVGLSGSLEALTLVDLFHTLRDRRLRGRLELCLEDHRGGYVLYVDGGYLQDIDALGGDTDALLLKILFENKVIDEKTYQRFRRFQEEDDGLSAPLVMRLRGEKIVSEEALKAAQRQRAEALFGFICGHRQGNFTFIEIQQGSNQAWPIHQLSLKIDEMVLKIARENQVDMGRSEATARTNLIMDEARTAGLDPKTLTGTERDLLEFFRQGQTLDKARRRFKDETDEPVDEVVQRLKSVELLKRTETSQSSRPSTVLVEDPHKMQTVVNSNWKLDLQALMPPEAEVAVPPRGQRAAEVPAEAAHAGPDDATHQRLDFAAGLPEEEMLFDTNELEDLLSEAIADADMDGDTDEK